jgi:hypothetical protein
MTDTIDDGQVVEYEPEALEASFGDYDLGDGIELSVLSADKQGSLKFEFVKVLGYARRGWIPAPFAVREEAWRCLAEHTREIDVWLLRCEHEVLELSDDTTLATCSTTCGDRYVRLHRSVENGRMKTFELTYAAWTYLANAAERISLEADTLRCY